MTSNPLYRRSLDFSTLYVFGAGGSGREIAWLAGESWGPALRVVHLVDREEYLTGPINGNSVELLSEIRPSIRDRFIVAIGSPEKRRLAVAACESIGLSGTSIVHPHAIASNLVEADVGVVIYPGVVITTNVRIGRHVHINVGCTISHDAMIGDFATLSPGIHMAGYVHVGQDVFIGTGATIINGIANAPLTIGEHAVVGAGACVTKAVPARALVVGVPATRKR